ncbi:MAG: N-acetylmuramoyl-L-alanine amidase [Lachnospiraceae bacterium]|nr:N-acetylmuramoyl-L-alanine amidase [Lachnospiraceae bacterium]
MKRIVKRIVKRNGMAIAAAVLLIALIFLGYLGMNQMGPFAKKETPEWVEEVWLTPNSYSRPMKPLKEVNNIVIHYVANPGTSAKNNRNYFENLKSTRLTKASSHFIVGLEGEILECVPLTEISYCSNDRNGDTVAIEVCHPDESGQFNRETYQSVVRLTAWLCLHYGLDEEDVIRHYDVTGKNCPKYYVEHEDAWEQLKADVAAAMGQN